MTYQRTFLCILTLALTVVAVPGADPPQPPVAVFDAIRDMQLTAQARRELARDRVLAPLKLEATVRDGIATVWGDVPSDAMAKLALAKVRQLEGIREVRSDLILHEKSPVVVPLAIPVGPPKQLASDAAKPNSDSGELPRKQPKAVTVANDGKKSGKIQLPQPGVLMLPAPSPKTPVLTTKGADKPSPASVKSPKTKPDSIASVLASDRYSSLKVEVEGSSVYIYRRDDDQEDLANALRDALLKTPGIREVVVRSR